MRTSITWYLAITVVVAAAFIVLTQRHSGQGPAEPVRSIDAGRQVRKETGTVTAKVPVDAESKSAAAATPEESETPLLRRRNPEAFGRNNVLGGYKLYAMHIAGAEAGDARSQYRVSQALQLCRSASKTREKIDGYYAEGRISEDLRDAMYQNHEACKDLFPLVSDIDAAYTQWLRKASEGGDSLAKSWESLLSYPHFDGLELHTLVRDALHTGEPEAIDHVVMFLANVPSTLGDNTATYEAWLLLDCEFAARCDLAQERTRIERDYALVENHRISSIHKKLRDAWLAKRRDELEF